MILSETEIWLFAVLDVCDNKWVKKQKRAAVLALPAFIYVWLWFSLNQIKDPVGNTYIIL